MRLNLDCVREILLCVEENTGLRKFCSFVDSGLNDSAIFLNGEPEALPEYQTELLDSFDNDELIYHVHYCIKAELLVESETSNACRIWIADLTPKGHDFLANIRDNKIWSGVKDIAGKVGAKSLDSVIQIASNVITALIKARFGLI